jgi:hypothetical protein
MENVAGENLSWFWKSWFYGTGNIDLAIERVVTYGNDQVIILANKGEVPMPVKLGLTYEDGSQESLMLPVEIWQRGDRWNYRHSGTKKLTRVEIDPDKILPDVNIANDSWPTNIYK